MMLHLFLADPRSYPIRALNSIYYDIDENISVAQGG